MKEIKLKYLFAPILLSIIIFSSDFLSTNLFQTDTANFSVWFVISLFAFACGWNIDKTLGWQKGSKIIFTTIVITSFITLVFITYFNSYFKASGPLTETMLLFLLRNFVLGLMAVFGLNSAELFALQKENETLKTKIRNEDEFLNSAKKDAEVIVAKAKLEAEKIIFDAEKEADKILEKKNKIEEELKEFIKIEKELIEKYDKDDI